MKVSCILNVLFFLLIALPGAAQIRSVAYDPDLALGQARDLAHSGHTGQARDSLIRILADFPDYADVETLLARTFSWEGNYDQARRHLNRVTSRHRNLEESWVAAIKNEVYAGNASLALGLANKAMMYLGSSDEISGIRAEILASNRGGDPHADPGNTAEIAASKDFIGIENAFEAFDQAFQPMVYAGLEYQHWGRLGKIIPRINYSNRFDIQGLQYELEVYPRISKTIYGYLNYGYSAAPTYPNHRIGAEVFANLPGALETSLGVRHLDFRESSALLLTGSFGLYRGNYYMSLRPFVSMMAGRDPGLSGSVLVRRYLATSTTYIGLRGIYGFNTEIRQLRSGTELLAETLLFVESQELQIEFQFGGAASNNRYRAQLGVSRQEFVFEPGSFFWALRAGFRYQVGL